MKALILEDDDLIAELLETVVAGLYSGVSVVLTETLGEALNQVKNSRFDLYIADRNLPDGSGLELVRQIRELDRDVPIVMVSGRSDRESVLQAAHYGIDGYMTKPFDVANLHERLGKLLKVDQTSEAPDLETLLRDSLEEVIQLPSDVDPADIVELIGREGDLSAAQLAERWREETSLTARLLDVANSSSFRRSGKPVETLRDAIGSLGVPLALNQALALSLDVSNKLQHEPLRELARAHHEAALQVAKEAQRLAIRLKKQPVLLQKAGLLSRLGELAVLKVLNQYAAAGGEIGAADAEKVLEDWAQAYGNRLKVQWRLPLGVRELIGAVHFLPNDCTREERLIMRAASLLASGEQGSEQCRRLLRRIGMETKETEGEKGNGE
ncbi:two-component system response regulator [Marinobacter guineae]|uniref:Two-component system response regulator n=1 Tax=Marinobacter guineae TaxID=432303 RepID=A0A2G1VEP0_9GAMM|nr:response regulator [Marinobacter guineae]PHQ25206.1 two-component system response regulator [Marinobacter guineae]